MSFLYWSLSLLLGLHAKVPEFPGQIVTINKKASLIKAKLDFVNSKYLIKGNNVSFWNEQHSKYKCQGKIIGKTQKYFLIKAYEIEYCSKYTFLNVGVNYLFSSFDFQQNIRKGKKVLNVLSKKHMAIKGLLEENKKELGRHLDKVDIVSKKYEILFQKLRNERSEKIQELEEYHSNLLIKNQDLKSKLYEIQFKIEQYRVEDKNFSIDQWSLDPKLYYRK